MMSRGNVPKWPIRFLRTFCPDHLIEEIEGDLIQKFAKDVATFGARRAKARLVWNTLRFFRPGIMLRNTFSITPDQGMVRHFFKIFLRTSIKHVGYTFINISGLVIGLTACMLISLYVWNERSYDDFHIKKDRIFRVRHDRYHNGELNRQWAAGPMGIGSDLKNNFPEVQRFVRLNKGVTGHVLSNGDIVLKEDRVFYASEDFFKVFSFQLLKGVDSLVLRQPFTMVVSESMARRYFGDEDPIGKILKCNGKEEYTISGVFKDVPGNSHLKFDALFSFESLIKILGPTETEDLLSNWGWEGTYTYIELSPSADATVLQAKFPVLVEAKMGSTLREWNEGMEFVLLPLSSIHLHAHAPDELESGGNGQTTSLLALTAVFILVMGWINYVNLATARSMERAKEVGIRKVLGSSRSKLIRQFLFESFAIMSLALLISLVMAGALLSSFSSMAGRTLDLSVMKDITVWIFVATVFTTGVMGAGLYPALVISGYNPVSILKGKFQNTVKGTYLRKGLVTVQFVSSIVLIVGTLVVYRQIQFMRNTPSGFNLEQVMVIKGPTAKDSAYFHRFQVLRESLQRYPDIRQITVSTDVPGQAIRNSNGNARLVGQDVKNGNTYQAIMTDENFIPAYGLSILTGRNFSGTLQEQWNTAIVNETAMKLLGITEPEKIIGQRMHLWGDTPEIIGVVKDYHQESLKQNVKPLVLVYDTEVSDFYSVKIKTRKPMQDIILSAEQSYKNIFPGNPFQYFFIDDHYEKQYEADKQFGKIIGLFTILAVVIAGLGLLGLSSYLVLQRTKEIGIRKILGATVEQITILVSKEFIVTIIVANVIAWPIAHFVAEDWLNSFAHRIDLDFLIFLIPAVIVLIVALLTVATQSIKAAHANPVKNLKTE